MVSKDGSVLAAITGASLGFMVGSYLNKDDQTNNDQGADSITVVYELQSKVNEALLNSIRYEEVITKLKQQLALPLANQNTIDFLTLQLSDVTKLYDSLLLYARSKIPELPTSFEVVESVVEGLHYNDKLVFDRNKKDRNISIVNGCIKILGVDNYPIPVFNREQGIVTELKSIFNSALPAKVINIDSSTPGSQIFFGNNERSWVDSDNSVGQMAEPLLLIEFDKNVDLRTILSNIKFGVVGRAGGMVNASRNISGFVSLYRSNILAVKLLGIPTAVGEWSILNLVHLQMSTITGIQQLMILSAAVVDSKQVHVSQHNPTSPTIRASNFLMNKTVPFLS